jgi:hypothetical protein
VIPAATIISIPPMEHEFLTRWRVVLAFVISKGSATTLPSTALQAMIVRQVIDGLRHIVKAHAAAGFGSAVV